MNYILDEKWGRRRQANGLPKLSMDCEMYLGRLTRERFEEMQHTGK